MLRLAKYFAVGLVLAGVGCGAEDIVIPCNPEGSSGFRCGSDVPPRVAIRKLLVKTVTSGEDIDPDGYTLTIVWHGRTRARPRSIGTNDLQELDFRDSGDFFSVRLTEVADNCTVSSRNAGGNPRTIRIGSGEIAEKTFEVGCTAISP